MAVGVHGEHLEHAANPVEEERELVQDNAQTPHLLMEEETALEHRQSRKVAMSICAQVNLSFVLEQVFGMYLLSSQDHKTTPLEEQQFIFIMLKISTSLVFK